MGRRRLFDLRAGKRQGEGGREPLYSEGKRTYGRRVRKKKKREGEKCPFCDRRETPKKLDGTNRRGRWLFSRGEEKK